MSARERSETQKILKIRSVNANCKCQGKVRNRSAAKMRIMNARKKVRNTENISDPQRKCELRMSIKDLNHRKYYRPAAEIRIEFLSARERSENMNYMCQEKPTKNITDSQRSGMENFRSIENFIDPKRKCEL